MAVRQIVEIDEELCDGCGLCVPACAEGALQIIDGKAKLVKDIYCDGLGACLGKCPQDAITIIEREADSYNEEAVEKHLKNISTGKSKSLSKYSSCPGSAMRQLEVATEAPDSKPQMEYPAKSQLGQWPVQLILVPPHAPFLKDSDMLICADCVPFAVPDFHNRYLKERTVLVGCPKLDDLQYYYEKLKAIFDEAKPRRITVLKMEVPCCGGIAQAALQARDEINSKIPVEVHTIGIRGGIEIDKGAGDTAA